MEAISVKFYIEKWQECDGDDNYISVFMKKMIGIFIHYFN